MTKVIRLTEAQYASLQAFIDKCAHFDSAQDALCEVAEEILPTPVDLTEEQEEAHAEAQLAIQDGLWEAIENATEE